MDTHILNALHDLVTEARKNEEISKQLLEQIKELNAKLEQISKIVQRETL